MAPTIRTDDVSEDLFDGRPADRRANPPRFNETPSELMAARALCRELSHKSSRHDKQRITHLICLNLITLLRHGPDR